MQLQQKLRTTKENIFFFLRLSTSPGLLAGASRCGKWSYIIEEKLLFPSYHLSELQRLHCLMFDFTAYPLIIYLVILKKHGNLIWCRLNMRQVWMINRVHCNMPRSSIASDTCKWSGRVFANPARKLSKTSSTLFSFVLNTVQCRLWKLF